MKSKKTLGQHFLTSRTTVSDIVHTANLSKNDVVLEIGPGRGILTSALLESAKKVFAIEKDVRLVVYLKEKFASDIKSRRLILVHDDILTCNLSRFKIQNSKFKLIANIPYYITGEILRKFLESDIQPSRAVLLVQKEVAERIARSKKESILSLSVKAYGTPRYIKTVSARYFKPKPKVDSAVLAIENISKKFFSDISEKIFFTLVKEGFAHKRKLLASNIKHFITEKNLEDLLRACDIQEKTRAENLSLDKWKCLAKSLE
jgi:16S rRNA (adenine1518-N6/adenine1519-N6)-dimethyltransferase